MGACATKPKVSKSDKAAIDAPALAPEEVVEGTETTAETKREEEVVVAAEAEQSESVKEVVDVKGGQEPRSLSLLLEEDNQKAKAEREMTSSETTEPLESSSEPQTKTEESETKPPELQESAVEQQQPAPAVEATEAVEKEKAIESASAPAAEPTEAAEKKTEAAEAIAKEEAKE